MSEYRIEGLWVSFDRQVSRDVDRPGSLAHIVVFHASYCSELCEPSRIYLLTRVFSLHFSMYARR